ncbi:hypothetical protein D3C81_1377590 [compost metagenome]
MVNYEINRYERIDLFRVAACFFYGVTHSSQINYNRYTSEILQYDAGRNEWNFLVVITAFTPAGDLLHMLFRDCSSVILADSCFKKYFNGKWQFGNFT